MNYMKMTFMLITVHPCKWRAVEGTHLDEEDKVLERGVEMGLLLELDDRVKVLVVDVGVDPEQTLQDGLGHRHEVLGEGHSCRRRRTIHRFDNMYKESIQESTMC